MCDRNGDQTIADLEVRPPHLSDVSGMHANNKIAGRIIPFLVLRFWDKNTGICAGAMLYYRRNFQPLPAYRRFTQKKGMMLPVNFF